VLTVFLVDDHEVVRRGVADLLDEEDDLTVIGQAGTVADALSRVPALMPDVVVLDVRLPDGNGVELCRELRSRLPELNCLMFTSFTDEQAMMDAILAGAGGYVIKDIKGMDLVSAVRTVGSGRSLLDNRRGTDQPADRRADVPGREDRQELRVQRAGQAGHGAAHPDRRAGHQAPRPRRSLLVVGRHRATGPDGRGGVRALDPR